MIWPVTVCVPLILGDYLLHPGTKFSDLIGIRDRHGSTTRYAQIKLISAPAPTSIHNPVFSTPAGMLLLNWHYAFAMTGFPASREGQPKQAEMTVKQQVVIMSWVGCQCWQSQAAENQHTTRFIDLV